MHAKYPTLSTYPLIWISPYNILSEWIQPFDKAFAKTDEIAWNFSTDQSLVLSSGTGKTYFCLHFLFTLLFNQLNLLDFSQKLSVRLDIDTSDIKILEMKKDIHLSFSLLELKVFLGRPQVLGQFLSIFA